MKNYLFIIFSFFMLCGCSKEKIEPVTLTEFPDALFYGYMQIHYDTNNDYVFQPEEIAAVTELDLSKETYIFNLKGLEKFTALRKLNISGLKNLQSNKLILTNPELFMVVCNNTNLKELDVSSLTNLEMLYCSDSGTKISDLSKNEKLYQLICTNNYSQDNNSWDLSDHPNLNTVDFTYSKFENIFLTNCKNLESFVGRSYTIKSVYVNGCSSLKSLDLYGASVLGLDISSCSSLEYLDLTSNNTGSLDLNNCVQLKTLKLGNTHITSINVDNLKVLEVLDLKELKISSLDLSHCKELKELALYPYDINELDITNNPKLEKIIMDVSGVFRLNPFIIYLSENQKPPYLYIANNINNFKYEFRVK